MSNIEKLANWYFTRQSLPYWCIMCLDNLLVFLCYIFVFQQFHSGTATLLVLWELCLTCACYTLLYNVGFRLFRTYSGILRYSSFVDLQRVGFAMVVGTCLAFVLRLFLHGGWFVSLTALEMAAASLLAMLVLWAERVFVKIVYDASMTSINSQYAYIYGVQNAGVGIAKLIRNEKPVRFILKGFVADDTKSANRYLMGVRIHRLDSGLIDRMKAGGVEALIVSPYRAEAFRQNTRLQDDLIKAGIHIYMAGEQHEWNDSEARPKLKEISIEDLLPRDEIELDMTSVANALRGQRIMVTGSAGSIGSEMVRQIALASPKELILIDQAETPQHDLRLQMAKAFPQIVCHTIVTSITDARRMEHIFAAYRPRYVFHAAAYKHVPMMEDNPSESVVNNVEGTRTIADLAVKYGVEKFVMISTDKAVNPTNVMGCSKRICEIYVQSLDKAQKEGRVEGHTQFITTRFGNVLGSNGSVIPLFEEQIAAGGPVTVTHKDIVRYFMLIPEACKLVLEAGTKGGGGEIFVFDMGKPVRIAELAERMIMFSGAKGVKVEYTGLRAGEKLYEEVLNVAETTKPSFHEKIRIATVREYDYGEVCRELDELLRICLDFDNMRTVAQMKRIVPEFRSNNSVYEKLDKPDDNGKAHA